MSPRATGATTGVVLGAAVVAVAADTAPPPWKVLALTDPDAPPVAKRPSRCSCVRSGGISSGAVLTDGLR